MRKYTCTHATRCTHMVKCAQIQKHVHMWIHTEHLVSPTGEQWAGNGWSLATMSCNQMSSCVSLPTGTVVCLAFCFTGQCHRHTSHVRTHAHTHVHTQNVQAKGGILLKIGTEVKDAQNRRSSRQAGTLVKRSTRRHRNNCACTRSSSILWKHLRDESFSKRAENDKVTFSIQRMNMQCFFWPALF